MSLPTLATLWLTIGAVVAALLLRQGHPTELVLMAVVAWPLTAPMLAAPTGNRARIDAAVRKLHTVAPHEVAGLRAALHRLDQRLSRMDDALADTPELSETDRQALVETRRRARDGLDSVLSELARIRIRAELAGDTAALSDLLARVRALDEVSAWTGDTGAP